MDCLAIDSPHLGPRTAGSMYHGVMDSDFPPIDLAVPTSPGLSLSYDMMGELAHEAQDWAPATCVDNGRLTLDVCAFARSFEPELSSFASPGIPALETVQRKLAATHVDNDSAEAMEGRRARKRPRLMSLGSLAETDLMGVLNSAYDSMAASLATSLATSVLPHHVAIAVASRSDADYKHPHVHGEAPRPRAESNATAERSGADGEGDGEGDASASGEPTVRKIGAYTVEERKARIARFHRKRKERVWNHKVKYDCRKKLADNRPRYKGRFVRRCDIEKHNAMLAAQAAAAAAAKAAAEGGEAAGGKDGATGAGAASAAAKPAAGAPTRASSASSKASGAGSVAGAAVAPAATSS